MVNPGIITWARVRNGLTVDALATKMKRGVEEIASWEDGSKVPSYTCLEELAYTHLKIPLAVFFFPEPPQVEDPIKKFRRLPDCELQRFSSDTLYKLRLAQGYQDSLRELTVGLESDKKIFRDLNPDGLTPGELAHKIRGYLGMSREKQFAFHSADTAFKHWRHTITEAGIFVFKDTLKDKFISGFCLYDREWPIILVNNSTSFTRQIFTLIHELVHIIHGIHGVTDIDERYLGYMDDSERLLEIRCNQVAGQVLVPDELFHKDISTFLEDGIGSISRIADKYSVSREVILRRLLDHGIINSQEYEDKAAEWVKDYLRRRTKSTKGDYYQTKLAYLGEDFTKLAFANYSSGRIDQVELADHLNMKSRGIEKLEKYLRW